MAASARAVNGSAIAAAEPFILNVVIRRQIRIVERRVIVREAIRARKRLAIVGGGRGLTLERAAFALPLGAWNV
jgi:hypothetical protein